jgi:hypothetical protein
MIHRRCERFRARQDSRERTGRRRIAARFAPAEILFIGLTVLGLPSCRHESSGAGHSARQVSTGRTGNLLLNPSFEQMDAKGAPIGWISGPHATVLVDPKKAHSGQVAALGSTSHGATDYFSQTVRIQGGSKYWLGHNTRSDQAAQLARLQVNFGNDRGDTVDVKIEVVPTDSHWKWNQMTVTAPADAATATIYLQPQGSGEVWFDDVWFGSEPPPP